MISGIYQIKNTINGKCYIGSAVDLKKRWRNHLSALRRRGHYNKHLQRAFDKYGEATFTFSILEQIEDTSQLIIHEQHYLGVLNSEYNILPFAGNSLGFRHTDEALAKMSIANTGERNPNYGKTGEQSPLYGKHPSEETLAKRSIAYTGEGNPNYGKHHSEETKRKISEALMGQQVSDETKRKISEALMGRQVSEETKHKMSIARTGERNPMYGKHLSGEQHHNYGKHPSEETRQKISKRLVGNQNAKKKSKGESS